MLKKSSLHSTHLALGARMIEFGGWEMPVLYRGIQEEHQAVRRRVGLFDISHMGEIAVSGSEAGSAVQYLTCNDLKRLAPGKCQYTALLTDRGTFVDDIIVYPLAPDRFFLCVNAANTEKDFRWIQEHRPAGVEVQDVSAAWAQLAIQGPQAEATLQKLFPFALQEIKRFAFRLCPWQGSSVLLSRTGYTGEDGFELYCPPALATPAWEQILAAGQEYGILPCGLGARDTLRLEAAYPLYGHEIGPETNPYEAGLSWIVKLDSDDFLGKAALQKVVTQKPARILIGFKMEDRSIPRPGYEIWADEQAVGTVVSGTYAPSLERGIGTGFVVKTSVKTSTKIDIDIRGKKRKATVVQLPFYKPKQ